MANREESSDAASHDTFPGPGPLRSDEGRTSIRPVEQMVDAAIDRIEREYAAAHGVSVGEALTVATPDSLGLTRRSSNGRLRWKGLDVSDDFRRYAERVARGEDLPPFAGKILAEPDAVFPWEPGQRAATPRRQPLRHQFGVWGGAIALLGGVAWLIFGALHSLDNDPLHRGESPLGTAVFSNRPSDTPDLAKGIDAKGIDGANKTSGPLEQIVAATDTLGTTEPSLAVLDSADVARGRIAMADPPSAALQDGKTSLAPTSGAARPNLAPAAAPNAGAHAVITLSAPAAVPSRAAPSNAAASSGTTSAPNPLAIPHLAVSAGPAVGAGLPGAVGGSAIPSSGASGNINANVVASNSAPSAAQSDPKKEPGREASAMGALLVETPSF